MEIRNRIPVATHNGCRFAVIIIIVEARETRNVVLPERGAFVLCWRCVNAPNMQESNALANCWRGIGDANSGISGPICVADLLNHPVSVPNQNASVGSEKANVGKRIVCAMGAKERVGGVVEVVDGTHFLKENNVSQSDKGGAVMKKTLSVKGL